MIGLPKTIATQHTYVTVKRSHSPSRGLSLPKLLIIIATAGTIVGLLLPAPRTTSHQPGIPTCQAKMTQIARAIRDYARVHGRFPEASVVDEAGRPMHSWRVLILPYLGKQELYDAYDFRWPWNSPQNAQLATEIGEAFQCPSCESNDPTSAHTNYLALAGDGTIWGERIAAGDRSLAEVVLVVETASCDVNVLEPQDIRVNAIRERPDVAKGAEISSNHLGGLMVAYADGHVEFLSEPLLRDEFPNRSD